MFIRLSPAQATGLHGWGSKLKTTLTWRDIEESDTIDLDALMRLGVAPKELHRLQPDIQKWVLHCGARASHAKDLIPWGAHPIRDLHGDLADVMNLKACSRQLRGMGVTYRDLRNAGMTPETMRLMGLPLQGWMELGLALEDLRSDFTDAQLGRVFAMTRSAVTACFR